MYIKHKKIKHGGKLVLIAVLTFFFLKFNYAMADSNQNKTFDFSILNYIPYILLLLVWSFLLINKYGFERPLIKIEKPSSLNPMKPWLKVTLLNLFLIFILIILIFTGAGIGSSFQGGIVSSDMWKTYEHPIQASVVSIVLPLLGVVMTVWIIQIRKQYKFKYYIPFLIVLLFIYLLYTFLLALIYW